nr:hypothetical protein L203_04706 [Cryptococcus depauperatus CBS 7841]
MAFKALKYALFSFATASLVGAKVLHTFKDTKATYYYDYGYQSTGDRCAARGNDVGALSSVPHCEMNGPSYADLKTNRIVALNRTLMNGDLSAWCGKQVKVYQNDKEVDFGYELVAWDVCEAAESAPIIDLSVDAYVKLMPNGDCNSNNGNNPVNLRVEIVDNQIWAPAPGKDSYSPTPAKTLYTGGGFNGVGPINTAVPPWGKGNDDDEAGGKPNKASGSSVTSDTSKSTASPSGTGSETAQPTKVGGSSTGGECSTKGEQKCEGGSLYICNYVENNAQGLKWSLIAACPGGCDISSGASCKSKKKRADA